MTPEGSEVTVSCDQRLVMHKGKETECTHCSIEDNGVGIPATELDQIFYRFVESSHIKSKAGGTG